MSDTGYWVVIPAAGVGRRMGHATPKQYLPLAGKPVLVHTLERFAAHPAIAGAVVALSPDDPHWPALELPQRLTVRTVAGGAERVHSVCNALRALGEEVEARRWVLVHDAVRPCVRTEDIDRLIEAVERQGVGGLLAAPVRDTMKRVNAGGYVEATVDRNGLWHALTPQMFRLGELLAALEDALAAGALVTDEAAAMERIGQHPLVVEGSTRNIKITRPEDLAVAELYIREG